MPARLTPTGRVSSYLFDAVYRRNLVYNQCWEDPAVDQRGARSSARTTACS